MMIEWRAGLCVSEALALEVDDLSLDVELPTICIRRGKGRKVRIVPVHPGGRCTSIESLIRGIRVK